MNVWIYNLFCILNYQINYVDTSQVHNLTECSLFLFDSTEYGLLSVGEPCFDINKPESDTTISPENRREVTPERCFIWQQSCDSTSPHTGCLGGVNRLPSVDP